METSKKGRAVHVPPDEGESLWVAGDTYTFKGVTENTAGALLLFEASILPQCGHPPHVHHREDEAYYVLEGDLEVMEGDSTSVAGAGSHTCTQSSEQGASG